MVGIFKANNHFNTFLLFIYGLLLKLPFFFHISIPEALPQDNFLFVQLLNLLSAPGKQLPLIYPLISYLFLYVQALAFNKLVNSQKMITRPNYLPAMSYLLITSLFSEWNVLSSPLVINSFLIWGLSKMSNLHNSQHPKSSLFNIGAVIGIATFFYFPSLAFAALVIFSLIIMRPFKLDEWLMVGVGIITPYYFLYSYLFISDKLNQYRLPAFAVGYPQLQTGYWTLTTISILLLGFLAGIYFVRSNMRRQVVHTRKTWTLVFLYFLVAFFVPFVNSTYRFEYWSLTAIPLSAFISAAFFYPGKKWFPVLLHWSMVALVIVVNYIR